MLPAELAIRSVTLALPMQTGRNSCSLIRARSRWARERIVGLAAIIDEERSTRTSIPPRWSMRRRRWAAQDACAIADSGSMFQYTGAYHLDEGLGALPPLRGGPGASRLAAATAELSDVRAERRVRRGIVAPARAGEHRATFGELAVRPEATTEVHILSNPRPLRSALIGVLRLRVDSVSKDPRRHPLHDQRGRAIRQRGRPAPATVGARVAFWTTRRTRPSGVIAVVAIDEGVAVVGETLIDAAGWVLGRGGGVTAGGGQDLGRDCLAEHVRSCWNGGAGHGRGSTTAIQKQAIAGAPTMIDTTWRATCRAPRMDPNNPALSTRRSSLGHRSMGQHGVSRVDADFRR